MSNRIADRKPINKMTSQEVIIFEWYHEPGSEYIKNQ
jgi:hypothetical protein